MRKIGNRLIFDKTELRTHVIEYIEQLKLEGLSESEIDERIGAYYTDRLIKKYSRKEQEAMWQELVYLIMEVPGGVGMLIDNMDYMPEFEHYQFKCLKSAFGQK